MYALRGINLHYRYKNGPMALRGVNIGVRLGECVVVFGRNGSGKTTLIMVLAGLLKPTVGRVEVFGRSLDELEELRRLMGVVFQDPGVQIVGPTVEEDIMFTLRQVYDEAKASRELERLLDEFKLRGLRGRMPHRLSAGEKRRLSLATALAHNPSILLMDEPFSDLDPLELDDLLERIKELKPKKAILIATHNPEIPRLIADRVYILEQGKIVGELEGSIAYPRRLREMLKSSSRPGH